MLITHREPIDGTVHALLLAAAPVSALPIGFEADLQLLGAQGFDELPLYLSSLFSRLNFFFCFLVMPQPMQCPAVLEFADIDAGGRNFHEVEAKVHHHPGRIKPDRDQAPARSLNYVSTLAAQCHPPWRERLVGADPSQKTQRRTVTFNVLDIAPCVSRTRPLPVSPLASRHPQFRI